MKSVFIVFFLFVFNVRAEEVCKDFVAAQAAKIGLPIDYSKSIVKKSAEMIAEEKVAAANTQVDRAKKEVQGGGFNSLISQISSWLPRALFIDDIDYTSLDAKTAKISAMNVSIGLQMLKVELDSAKYSKKSAELNYEIVKTRCAYVENSEECLNKKPKPQVEAYFVESIKAKNLLVEKVYTVVGNFLRENNLDPQTLDFPKFQISRKFKAAGKEFPSIVIFEAAGKPLGVAVQHGPYERETYSKFESPCKPKGYKLNSAGQDYELKSGTDCKSLDPTWQFSFDTTYGRLFENCKMIYNVEVESKKAGTGATATQGDGKARP